MAKRLLFNRSHRFTVFEVIKEGLDDRWLVFTGYGNREAVSGKDSGIQCLQVCDEAIGHFIPVFSQLLDELVGFIT